TITEDGQTVELAYEVSETAIENTTTAIEELKIENEELKILIDNEQLIINNYRGGQVSVFDIAGRRLISQNSQLQIYIGGLPQGIYLVKAGNKTAKFIKR
ncbi:MAG: T9SS type A sorting domain-containing protein, partial [Dysgonamonadaceae bacterium]|nr:T9SS type A sorting domain-containing protein [Dysgonamonadaceae bacterium]